MTTVHVPAPVPEEYSAERPSAEQDKSLSQESILASADGATSGNEPAVRSRAGCRGFSHSSMAGLAVAFTLVALAGCRAPFRTGLEVLEAQEFAPLKGRSVAVVTNHTGVNRRLESIIDLLHAAPGVRFRAIFAPEHGVRGAAPAGAKVGDTRDARTGVPIYSLYGALRRPSREMLEGVQVILFDIQDIGVRTYTYLATLVEVLEVAARAGVEVWVLDRPVPIGGGCFQGPVLDATFRSFVGPHTVPLRHGLTAGEFARMVNAERGIGARLRVVAMTGYRRDLGYEETRLAWVAPSPNIPTLVTAFVYAGTVLVEGTNLSEGRGTTRPFQLIGAPWIDGGGLASELNGLGLAGVRFREAHFLPSVGKYAGEECRGVEIHVCDRQIFQPVMTAIALLQTVRRRHARDFAFVAARFDRLAGGDGLRKGLEKDAPFREIVASWGAALEDYERRRQRYLLYD